MSTKIVKLNLAHRNLLAALIQQYSGTTELDIEETVHIADISEAFDIKGVEDIIKALEIDVQRQWVKLSRETEAARKAISDFEDENPGTPAPDKLLKKFYAAEDAQLASKQVVSYSDLLETELLEFELSSHDLDWVAEIFKEYKWNARLSRNQQGGYDTTIVPLQPAEARAIKSLRDTIKSALI